MSQYPFRTTMRTGESSYCEDRGYPYHIDTNDPNFNTVHLEFGLILKIGQTATKSMDGKSWEISNEFPLLEAKRKTLYEKLSSVWSNFENHGVVKSTLGFPVDTSEKSIVNIDSRIKTIDSSKEDPITFCDANNDLHQISLGDLDTILSEIIAYRNERYSSKWAVRQSIDAAKTFKQMDEAEKSLNSYVESFNG